MHKYATNFVATTSTGLTLFQTTQWQEPPPKVYSPPLHLASGTTITMDVHRREHHRARAHVRRICKYERHVHLVEHLLSGFERHEPGARGRGGIHLLNCETTPLGAWARRLGKAHVAPICIPGKSDFLSGKRFLHALRIASPNPEVPRMRVSIISLTALVQVVALRPPSRLPARASPTETAMTTAECRPAAPPAAPTWTLATKPPQVLCSVHGRRRPDGPCCLVQEGRHAGLRA